MPMERGEYIRSRGMYRLCIYTGRNSTENVNIKLHGILKGENQPNALWKIGEIKISIPKPRILVQEGIT